VFFFIIPSGAPVLPTLLSRCVVIKDEEAREAREAGEGFLTMDRVSRLALAESFAKNQDREGARRLVRELLELAQEKGFGKKTLRDLLDAERFLSLSGSSPKSVISHLALTL